LIISAGHWIALSNLDVNVETLKNVAQANWGNTYSNDFAEIESSTNNYSEEVKTKKYKEVATKFVQQSAPCNYSNNINKTNFKNNSNNI
jgi:hypothetical protein